MGSRLVTTADLTSIIRIFFRELRLNSRDLRTLVQNKWLEAARSSEFSELYLVKIIKWQIDSGVNTEWYIFKNPLQIGPTSPVKELKMISYVGPRPPIDLYREEGEGLRAFLSYGNTKSDALRKLQNAQPLFYYLIDHINPMDLTDFDALIIHAIRTRTVESIQQAKDFMSEYNQQSL